MNHDTTHAADQIQSEFPHYKELDQIWWGIPGFDGDLVSSDPTINHTQNLLSLVQSKLTPMNTVDQKQKTPLAMTMNNLSWWIRESFPIMPMNEKDLSLRMRACIWMTTIGNWIKIFMMTSQWRQMNLWHYYLLECLITRWVMINHTTFLWYWEESRWCSGQPASQLMSLLLTVIHHHLGKCSSSLERQEPHPQTAIPLFVSCLIHVPHIPFSHPLASLPPLPHLDISPPPQKNHHNLHTHQEWALWKAQWFYTGGWGL